MHLFCLTNQVVVLDTLPSTYMHDKGAQTQQTPSTPMPWSAVCLRITFTTNTLIYREFNTSLLNLICTMFCLLSKPWVCTWYSLLQEYRTSNKNTNDKISVIINAQVVRKFHTENLISPTVYIYISYMGTIPLWSKPNQLATSFESEMVQMLLLPLRWHGNTDGKAWPAFSGLKNQMMCN